VPVDVPDVTKPRPLTIHNVASDGFAAGRTIGRHWSTDIQVSKASSNADPEVNANSSETAIAGSSILLNGRNIRHALVYVCEKLRAHKRRYTVVVFNEIGQITFGKGEEDTDYTAPRIFFSRPYPCDGDGDHTHIQYFGDAMRDAESRQASQCWMRG
jgi:hypothetical protein